MAANDSASSSSQKDKWAYPPVGIQKLGDSGLNSPILDDDPTVGYALNHCMLRIRDPKATLHFYTDLMGMRLIFMTNTGLFTVYYLGYPLTPKHRADPASYARDTAPQGIMSQIPGLLELSHCHGSEDQPRDFTCTGSKPPHLGFNHLGFSVPDVKAAVDRLKQHGVKVVKDAGEGPSDLIPVTQWEKEKGIATDELSAGFSKILRQIAFVEDPDGYLIELVPQEFKM